MDAGCPKNKGVLTSEFWLVITVLVGSLLFVFQGNVSWDAWMEFAKWIVITYLGARAVVKGVTQYANGKGGVIEGEILESHRLKSGGD